ncbi:hypothetical protein ABL78_5912 [Leptomonas seymouri]|uniref:Uncharacterized protein n=1 Tax=Leptomonas seymouri TaxID=5684 RepID=A0A0N1IJD0_LEPSE|nr:hypothetical protein ABL78_5912 [Leptomonas seymouri]|eukprot:KPI85028.1 hypothetical protein ABL78_5912 [Leptomonas seymouri]
MNSAQPPFDSPVTAVQWGPNGIVYFATGNVLYRSNTGCGATSPPSLLFSPVLPSDTTVRRICAPPSTVINTLALASCTTVTPTEMGKTAVTEYSTLVFMGAADHLLAQIDCSSGDPPRFRLDSKTSASPLRGTAVLPLGCLCVLRTAASRILRIVVDAARGLVLVLTSSNDLFYARLGDVQGALQARAASQYEDVSEGIWHCRVRGPPLGVVLAADILIDGDTGAGAALPPYRLFAATYAGTVVEWYPTKSLAEMREAPVNLQAHHRSAQSDGFCVAARIQAHPCGCAVFSVRVEQSTPPIVDGGGCQSKAIQRTHLVTCSDDRSVTLYERRHFVSNGAAKRGTSSQGKQQEGDWVLLWRGSGTSFSKSRVFDVAVCAVWSSTCAVTGSSCSCALSSATCWTCAAHVAAAGEDGCVQVVRVEKKNAEDEPLERPTSINVSWRFVRARQHRGHGAYRVAFCKPTGAHITLASGGFDGTVLAHSYPSTPLVEDPAPRRLRILDASTVTLEGQAPNTHLSVSLNHREASSTAAQVRVVHVDAAGHLLAFTSQMLCVQYHGGALEHKFWTPLPNTLEADALCGLPACAESFQLPVSTWRHESAGGPEEIVGVSCAIVGTTTGAVYAIPYAYSRVDGGTVHFVCQLTTGALQTDCQTTMSSIVATTALQPHGKVTYMVAAVLKASMTSSTVDQRQTVLVATNHVRHTVALSALRIGLGSTAHAMKTKDGSSVQMAGEWQFLSVLHDCPGPLTTALSLIPIPAAVEAATQSFWLLVGDKSGCLIGVRQVVSKAELCCISSKATLSAPQSRFTVSLPASTTLPASMPIKSAATVYTYVFPAHLHIAISALCVEGGSGAAKGTLNISEESVCEPIVLQITGTGGLVEFLCLPTLPTGHEQMSIAGEGATLILRAAPSREPLRLPFEISSTLAVSSQVSVVQFGTTVSVLYRIPGRTAWVLVDAYEDIRAPRLLTARICEMSRPTNDESATALAVFVAHCSDGHTVEQFSCFPAQPQLQLSSGLCARTSLLHGGGLPGKDYNCVTYAPAPLHCLIMGNEDSSLVVYPLHIPPAPDADSCEAPSLLRRVIAPINICGAHHSNILAIAVLPPMRTGKSSGNARFASVGGGAMINLWAADDASSPLRLVDWWCGCVPKSIAPPYAVEGKHPKAGSETAVTGEGGSMDDVHRPTSCLMLQKRRMRRALALPESVALTERIARFMCVTSWGAYALAVGSSDGMLLFFRIRPAEAVTSEGSTGPGSCETLQLQWQGCLSRERAKPILCVTSTAIQSAVARSSVSEESLGLLVAGDTNGFVYVVDTIAHRVVAQLRLEQSSVNALSEIHAIPSDPGAPDGAVVTRHTWRFAAMHDSGVIHLVQIDASISPDVALPHNTVTQAQLTVLSSAATGVTAGRGVRWTLASQPLLAITEERITYFDPRELQRGVLAILCERRVSIRCVSGAVVVPETGLHASEENSESATLPSGRDSSVAMCTLPCVAVVGQGFEMVHSIDPDMGSGGAASDDEVAHGHKPVQVDA